MADHRDGPRFVNAVFPVFEELPPRQQAVFIRLMDGPLPEESGFSDDADLAEEVEEAKAHFRTKLSGAPPTR